MKLINPLNPNVVFPSTLKMLGNQRCLKRNWAFGFNGLNNNSDNISLRSGQINELIRKGCYST